MSTQNEAIERAATNGCLDVMKWLYEQHEQLAADRLMMPVTFEIDINDTPRTFEGKLTD